jgi:hypothetical protein
MSTRLSFAYMVAEAATTNDLAREVDHCVITGWRLQGGVSVCQCVHPLTGKPVMWYAQALVFETFLSDNDG